MADSAMPAAFYVREGDRFVATEHARGPWSPDHQHGGPPTALLVGAIEENARRAAERDGRATPSALARVTVEIVRPVPTAGAFRVALEAGPGGKQVQRTTASLLLAADGTCVARASALLIRRKDVALPPRPGPRAGAPVLPGASAPFEFPFFRQDIAGYHKAMEVRFAAGTFGKGPTTAWMRLRVAIVAGEKPSPWQRVAAAADSGNGVSIVADPAKFLFVNPDLTIHLHREPAGEWVALEAESILHEDGVGLAESTLHDEAGPIGRACQSLLVDRR